MSVSMSVTLSVCICECYNECIYECLYECIYECYNDCYLPALQAFSDYQIQQLTSNFIDQFGLSDEEFSQTSDNRIE